MAVQGLVLFRRGLITRVSVKEYWARLMQTPSCSSKGDLQATPTTVKGGCMHLYSILGRNRSATQENKPG